MAAMEFNGARFSGRIWSLLWCLALYAPLEVDADWLPTWPGRGLKRTEATIVPGERTFNLSCTWSDQLGCYLDYFDHLPESQIKQYYAIDEGCRLERNAELCNSNPECEWTGLVGREEQGCYASISQDDITLCSKTRPAEIQQGSLCGVWTSMETCRRVRSKNRESCEAFDDGVTQCHWDDSTCFLSQESLIRLEFAEQPANADYVIDLQSLCEAAYDRQSCEHDRCCERNIACPFTPTALSSQSVSCCCSFIGAMSTVRLPTSTLSPTSTASRNTLPEITEIGDDEEFSVPVVPKDDETVSPAVNLDGVDWFLTTVLVTVDLLLLELHRTEDTKWATLLTWVANPDCDSGWLCRLSKTLFVLVVAVVNVLILVPIVNINIRTPSRSSWRFWLLSAWASLILLNTLTALQVTDSILNALDDKEVEYWASHFFLVGMVVVSTCLLDLRFVMLYGVCTCMTCFPDATLEFWNGLRAVQGKPMKIDRIRLRDVINLRRLVDRSMYGERTGWHGRHRDTFNFVKNSREMVSRFVKRRRLQAMRHMLSHRGTTHIAEMPTEEVGQYLDEIMASKSYFYFNVLKQRMLLIWDGISEEQGFFEYSSWMKAAISFTILMLLYNFIKAVEVIYALDSAWSVGHDAVQQLESGLNEMTQSAVQAQTALGEISELASDVEMTQSWTATYESLMASVRSLDLSLEAFLPEGITSSESYRRAGAMMHLVLIRASQLTERGDFDAEKVISAFYYMDSLIGWLKYACLVGYPIGTFIGFYSLYQVMKQHKDMSMGLAREQQVRAKMVVRRAATDSDTRRESLMGLEDKYPIGGAVYFIGVLASTAVVQQHAFGMCSTLCVAVFLNIKKFDILLNCGGYIALIYACIVVANYLFSHIIGDYLLTKDSFKIKRPWLFFNFLFIFTIIHAVLGFFYALWRALLLFVTTLWVLNRLDICLFQTGKKLDNGHYSFMSMLLLTHIIRLENEARVREGDPVVGLEHASESTAAHLLSQKTAGNGELGF